MIIGFTGTRDGMNAKQIANLKSYFKKVGQLSVIEFHHGDCIGADKEANDIARTFHFKTHGHPPVMERFRAYTKCDVWHKPRPYLDRNQDIVDICDTLVVAPRTNTELLRSGTWATYRDANRIGRTVFMLER